MPDDLRIAPALSGTNSDRIDAAVSNSDARTGRRTRARFSGLLSLGAAIAPGGGAVSVIANGAQAIVGAGGREEQMDQMWQMQQDSQFFNMEYMELQQAAQAENRRFSSLSNLMKARHDTAKAAINNIRV